jgi:hypothetical protein
MPETPNHSYNVPEEGASDWHEPLNENFRQYDADIEIRDESSNAGDYDPVQGAKFLATDTGVVHVGDGSNWIPTLALARYRAPTQSNTPGVAFGYQNSLNGDAATVGGGGENEAGAGATVAGGVRNAATGGSSTIGGGADNSVTGRGSVVGGGSGNSARGGSARSGRGGHATVPGGKDNDANGSYSLAAGRLAKARKNGSFVWGDSTEQGVGSDRADQFVVQAGGGVAFFSASDGSAGVDLPQGSGSWASMSAASAKSDVEPVDPEGVLSGVEELDVSTWEYDAEDGATHMGPMAGAFHDAFGLGADADRIATVDADGVALAAIQGLAARLARKDDRIGEQAERLDEQADRIETLAAENEALRDRLAALEARVDEPAADGSEERAD